MTWTSRLKILAAAMIGWSGPTSAVTLAQEPPALPVSARVEPGGPFLVGQGVTLTVVVAAGDRRPSLELPPLKNARIWKTSSSFQPLGASAIGGSLAGENAFVTRLRLVAQSPGVVDVPPIVARLDDREGRSPPPRLTFENPPIPGRPPGFLGGVGDFQIQAELDQARIRVGREVEYRIRVTGPAAWGMTAQPDLARLHTLPIAPEVESLAVEAVDEPPSRTFVYRLKPTATGDVVLPPVLIASFDPRTKRYMTRATRGVPLQVVAAPVFDAAGLDDYQPPAPSRLRAVMVAAGWLALGAAVGVGAIAAGRRLRRRWVKSSRAGRTAARRFAREFAERLADDHGNEADLAREALDALVEYARLAAERPPGALTPDEARAAVALGSGSEMLGDRAAGLTARCDQILFAGDGEATGGREGEENARSLRGDAQALFAALGRSSNGWSRLGIGRVGAERRENVAPEPQVSEPPGRSNDWPRC